MPLTLDTQKGNGVAHVHWHCVFRKIKNNKYCTALDSTAQLGEWRKADTVRKSIKPFEVERTNKTTRHDLR